MRNRTKRQLREWRWIVWFLLIGWWYMPLIFVVWIMWELVKMLAFIVECIIITVKDLKDRG